MFRQIHSATVRGSVGQGFNFYFNDNNGMLIGNRQRTPSVCI